MMSVMGFHYVEKGAHDGLFENIQKFVIGEGDAFMTRENDEWQLFGEKVGQTLAEQEMAYRFKLIRGNHVIHIKYAYGRVHLVIAKTLLDEAPVSRADFIKTHFREYDPIDARNIAV